MARSLSREHAQCSHFRSMAEVSFSPVSEHQEKSLCKQGKRQENTFCNRNEPKQLKHKHHIAIHRGVKLCKAKGQYTHSRLQRPRSFWSAPRIATSGHVQNRKSAIHGLPVTLRMLRVKSDKSDWFWSQSIVFTDPFKTVMSLDWPTGRDSWC